MKFVIFEHVDDNGVPQGRDFSSRLSLVEEDDPQQLGERHLLGVELFEGTHLAAP
jgi:hypothetical protein